MSTPPSLKSDSSSQQAISLLSISHHSQPTCKLIEAIKKKFQQNTSYQKINKNHLIEINKNYLIKDEKIFSEIYPISHEIPSIPLTLLINDIKKALEFKEKAPHLQQVIEHFIDQMTHLNGQSLPFHNLFNTLGEVIYLIDHEPKKLLELFQTKDIEKLIEGIHALFNLGMKKIHKKIDTHCQAYEAAPIQNSETARQLIVPIEIVKILLPSSGIFNRALIPRMIAEFTESTDPIDTYQARLRASLHLLGHSESLQDKLLSICFSKPENPLSAEVVRMALRIPQDKKLSHVHARRCALTALLTHLRQGSSNSCFASFFAIELQTQAPLQTLDDFGNLLSGGYLSRLVDQQLRQFPFLLKWGQEELVKSIKINKKGYLLSSGKDSKAPFWKAPGLKRAFKALGISHPTLVLQNWLTTQSIPAGGLEISIEKLLQEITGSIEKKAFERCCLEFASANSHPLLRVWENALAGMAEGKKGGILRKAFTKSLHYLIGNSASKNGLKNFGEQIDLFEKIEKWTTERIHYLYDPNYILAFHPHLQGAFILYDTKNQDAFDKWEKIDTAFQFQKLLSEFVTGFLQSESIPMKLIKKIVGELCSDQSLQKLLKKYHKENVSELRAQKDFDQLRCTPWITLIGNDPKEVLKVYYEGESYYNIYNYTPQNAKDLISFFISLLIDLKEDIKRKYYNGNYLSPVRVSGIHAFSLLLSHPSIKDCYNSPFHLKNWITEKTYLPGKKMAETLIPERMRKEIADCVSNRFIIASEKKDFLNAVKSCSKKITIKGFREFLAKEISGRIFSNSHTESLLKFIDLKILEFMPKDLQKKWVDSVIHFADSNWQKSGRDIHYGVAVNPGTGELEMVAVLDNGELFEFIDQRHFFNGHIWELYL